MTEITAPHIGPPHGLRPDELAEAAILTTLSVVLVVLGSFLPGGGIAVAAAIAPYASLSARHRMRVLVMAGAAGAAVLFLVLGPNGAIQQVGLAAYGLLIGTADRRRWGLGRTLAVGTVTIWTAQVAFTVALLAVLSDLRILLFDQVEVGAQGFANFVARFGLSGVGDMAIDAAEMMTRYWYLTVMAALFVTYLAIVTAGWFISRPALARIDASLGSDVREHHAEIHTSREDQTATIAPLPSSFEHAGLTFDSGSHRALEDITLTVEPATFTAVVGHNGSGKSSLLALLAGTPPTSGAVARPGRAGLGQTGGTAVVFQRPESQILGVHVADDVEWGLPADHEVDIHHLLDRVGMAGMGSRETSTLSGGELQRLAIASALARRPALLLSDESTAMIDPTGRHAVLALLRSLTDEGVAVVHVTHMAEEARLADVVVTLDAGHLAAIGSPDAVLGPPPEVGA